MQNQYIIVNLNTAVKNVQQAFKLIEITAAAYLFNPFGTYIENLKPPGAWIDIFFTESKTPEIKKSIENLMSQLTTFESRFKEMSLSLKKISTQKPQLVKSSVTLALSSKFFLAYVKEELKRIDQNMICCYLHHDVQHTISWKKYTFLTIMCLGIFLTVLFAIDPKTRKALTTKPKVKKEKEVSEETKVGHFTTTTKRKIPTLN